MKNRLILGAAIAALMTGLTGCAVLTATFKTDLSSAMSAAKPQFSQCYAQGLTRNPKLEGPLTLNLTVQRETTALSNVTVEGSQPSDPAFEQCIARVAQGLQVDKAPHLTVRASFPISFTPAP
jgi:hypothetical protein